MHSVDLLEAAMDLAQRLGYTVRQEWFGGSGGGTCAIGDRKMLFVDLALWPADQLELVLDALRREPGLDAVPMRHELREILRMRKSA